MKRNLFRATWLITAVSLFVAAPARAEIRAIDHKSVAPPSGGTIGAVFTPSSKPAPAPAPTENIVRSRPVELNWSVLAALDPDADERIDLPLFDDVQYEGIITGGEITDEESCTITGKLAGVAFADFLLVRFKDAVTLRVSNYEAGKTYFLQAVGDGPVLVRELGRATTPDCGTPPPPNGGDGDGDEGGIASAPDCLGYDDGHPDDFGPVVDVLICFTPDARSGAGGTSGMVSTAISAIDDMNQRLGNSGLTVRVRLVWVAVVDYDETGDGSDDLNALAARSDVADLRSSNHADLVAFIVESSDVGGIARRPNPPSCSQGFALVRRTAIPGGSFAHELGHNFGNCHSLEEGACDNPVFGYSHGYRWTCLAVRWHDTMSGDAFDPFSSRIPYYSNPNIMFNCGPNGGGSNQAIGDDDTANATATIGAECHTVANNYHGDWIRYVRTVGGGYQNGSQLFPYRSIAGGVNAAPPGATVLISLGDYTGDTGVFNVPHLIQTSGGTVVWH